MTASTMISTQLTFIMVGFSFQRAVPAAYDGQRDVKEKLTAANYLPTKTGVSKEETLFQRPGVVEAQSIHVAIACNRVDIGYTLST